MFLQIIHISHRCIFFATEFRADFIRKKRIHVNSAYFAPELRQMLKFTKKTDVYAYGIILLELYLTTKSRVALKDFKDKIKDSNAVPSSISILINSSLQLLDKKRPNFVQISESLESNMDVIKSFIPVLSSALPPVAATGRTDLSMTVFDMSGTSSKRKCQLLQSKRSRIILSISILIFIVLIALITVVIKMFLPAAASSEKTSSGSSTNSISTSSSLSFSWTANSSWGGINSEFLYALSSDQQDQIISATVGANLKTIRYILLELSRLF